jgi:hypothetical protein
VLVPCNSNTSQVLLHVHVLSRGSLMYAATSSFVMHVVGRLVCSQLGCGLLAEAFSILRRHCSQVGSQHVFQCLRCVSRWLVGVQPGCGLLAEVFLELRRHCSQIGSSVPMFVMHVYGRLVCSQLGCALLAEAFSELCRHCSQVGSQHVVKCLCCT